MVPFVLGQHKIVFHGSRGNSDNQDVFVISQDGTQLEQLTHTTGRSQDPQWLAVPDFRDLHFLPRAARDGVKPQ